MTPTTSVSPDTGRPAGSPEPSAGAGRVLWLSTAAFTLMFAAWLMFGILGVPIQKELGLSDTELSWISAVAVLNGSLWRLPAGMITDRIGGRKVMTLLLVFTAIPAWFVAQAHSYGAILALAFLVGFAGNVGASVTKFIGPPLIAGTAGATYVGGAVEGGWRLVPVIYAALLLVMAVVLWFGTPAHDRMAGQSATLASQLAPLKQLRVWRFSLYYVAFFGAYVALAAWLPKYYVDNFQVSLTEAGLLTALYIFPASLLRPLATARRASTCRTTSASWPSLGCSSCSAARWASARPPCSSTSPSTSRTTSAPSAVWSACSEDSAGSSCRRFSPTPRPGRASRPRRSSSCSCSSLSASYGCTGPSSRCCTRSPRSWLAGSRPRPPSADLPPTRIAFRGA